MKKIAFAGLGNMGLPMALNLAKKHAAVCFDISRRVRVRAQKDGLSVADSAAAAADRADIVITMLPAGEHVRDFFSAKVLAAVKPGALLIDCSTVAPEDALQTAAVAAAHGLSFADAPVSGGVAGARAASLSFLVGGDEAAFRRARRPLSAMGANIFHAGGAGAGQAAKLCNNMMLSVQMAGLCEALTLGEKMGLNPKTLSEIMKKSSGNNWALQKYNPLPGITPGAPAGDNYRGGFAVDLMVKDSNLAMRAANKTGSPTPLGALANQLYRLHQAAGNGAADFSGIIKMLRQ